MKHEWSNLFFGLHFLTFSIFVLSTDTQDQINTNPTYIKFNNSIKKIHTREKGQKDQFTSYARQRIVGDLWVEHENGNLTDQELESLLNQLRYSGDSCCK